MALVEVRSLVNRFGRQVVHDHLDFDLESGEIIGLIGGSGSGKSVLLNSMIGLHSFQEGSVHIKGKSIRDSKAQRDGFFDGLWGVLFQNGALFSSLTLLENVAFPLIETASIPPEEAYSLAEMKIELVGLSADSRHKYPSDLSGGMVKRAALARALALDPEILFLDEPTAGLDPIGASAFDHLIKDLSQSLEITVMMVSHDLDSLFSICDRLAVLVDKKLQIGTVEEMLANDHPWIKQYFHGDRSRAAFLAAQKSKEKPDYDKI